MDGKPNYNLIIAVACVGAAMGGLFLYMICIRPRMIARKKRIAKQAAGKDAESSSDEDDER